MDDYLGILIEQSLRDPAIASELNIQAVKRGIQWTLLLVSVPERDLASHVDRIQSNLADDGTWYAHYFRGSELVVVYRDAVFSVSTDPASWRPAVQHGIALGIPKEQLDYAPRTRDTAMQYFSGR